MNKNYNSSEFWFNRLNKLPSPKLVFRIENESGEGPYSVKTSWQTTPHGYWTGRPSPDHDPGFKSLFSDLDPNPDYDSFSSFWFDLFLKTIENNPKFGFSSLSQLNRWFNPKEFEKLSSLGFKVVEYSVENSFDSGTQVIFWESTND